MELFYDPRDDRVHEQRGSGILYWLDDLGAKPLDEARPHDEGFLFAGARPLDDYRRLTAMLPRLRDRPDERAPLLQFDTVLEALASATALVPMPRTWSLALDQLPPDDLTFPLFVRTAQTSWKLGGRISRVRNLAELEEEAFALRRAFGWDALILAREWLDLAKAGEGRYGPVPQEIRVWIVDSEPWAWAFHYLNVLPQPKGFPPSEQDLALVGAYARQIGAAFRSRLIAADFARRTDGTWCFIEAGPGSCAGTAHETAFKAMARRLRSEQEAWTGDAFGGPFP